MKTIRQSVAVKVISWVLIATLSLSSFSELAYAADISPAEKVIKEDEVTEENITEKSESTTTYYLGEGKNMTVWHGGQVRFEDEDGNLTDYEPQLEEIEKEKTLQGKDLKGYSFTNKEGDAKHYLPEKIGEDAPLIMEKEDFAIEMSLADETVKMLGLEDAHGIIKEETVQTIEGEEKLPVTAVYENKDSASLALTSTPGSVKETITLLEKPESSVLKYEIKLSGLTARKNVLDEGITYYDREKNIAGYMASPWMNDASGKNYSENIKCTLKKSDEKGKYIVEMHIDEEYLSSEDTQYPVVIDPTNTWQGNSQIRDAYVISGSTYGDTNFYDSGTKKMPVGKNNTGTHRTYLKLYDLYAVTKGCSVTSAKLTVYETGSGQAGQSIGICRVPSSWEPADITNNNRPVGTTLYSSITSKGTEGSSSVFDILTYVKNVASGSITNYGLMLYNKMDNPGIATFYGSRTGDTAKRPKLVVTYYSIPTVATASELKIKEGKQGNKYNKTLYVKNSEDTYFSFSGIISNGLKRVEQRIRYWNDETQTSGSIVKDYGESTTVTNGGSMISLPEGCYINYIRGVNTAGVAGEAKTTGYIHVDKTTPTINSFNLKQTTTESSPTNDKCPEIEWKVADKHFRSVSVIQNGKFVKTGLTPKVGSYKYAEGNTAITKSGKYDIKIRAYDWAGNYKDSAVKSYYVDSDAPDFSSVTINPATDITSYTTNLTPTVSWNVSDTDLSKVVLAIDEKQEVVVTDKQEYIVPDGVITESGTHSFKITAYDKAGNTRTKVLKYYVDIQKPTGTITVTEQGTGNGVDIVKDTVNICSEISDSESGLENANLDLYKISYSKDEEGKETEEEIFVKNIFENNPISSDKDFDTKEFDNGKYRLKLIVYDKVGNQSTVTQDITIANPITAPTVIAKHVESGPTEISWEFPEDTRISSLEYRLTEETEWVTVSDSAKSEGKFTIDFADDEGKYVDGTHKVEIRGVDDAGIKGNITVCTCIVDGTVPVVEIKSLYQGGLSGTAKDQYLKSWEVFYKEKDKSDYSYTQLFSGDANCEDSKLGFIDLSKLDKNKYYTIKLIAEDMTGNKNEDTYDVYVSDEDSLATEIAALFNIKRQPWADYEKDNFIIGSNTNKLELETSEGYDLSDKTVYWYVNNKRVTIGEVYEDDFDTETTDAKYTENEEYNIFVISKDDTKEDKYSRKIRKNGEIRKIDFSDCNLDEGICTKEINLDNNAVSFRLNGNRTTNDGKNIIYKIKTADNNWFEVYPEINYSVSDLTENAYINTLQIEVSVEGEAEVTSIDEIQMDFDIIVNPETFSISVMDNYVPTELAVKDKVNYKTYLYWDNNLPENENISYEVHRGTTENFTPSDDTLAASDIKAGYYCEINVNYGDIFYYKVRAVKKDDNGNIISKSNFSNSIGSKVIDSDEYTKRMGLKEYWKYAEVEMPNGTASVEKSEGNFVYQQKDAEIPNEQLEVEFIRSYNSMSSAKTAFGIGWTHDFDMELLSVCNDETAEFENIILKDGSGTIYHFIKQEDGSYISSLGKYITLEKEEKTEKVEIPVKSEDDSNGGLVRKVEVNSSYTIKTKDNIEYRFNSGGQMVYKGEPNGNFLLFEYDDNIGLLSQVVTSKNIAIKFEYQSYDYDSDKLLVDKMILPDGTVTNYTYEKASDKVNYLLSCVTENPKDGKSISYNYGYDSYGNLTTITDAQGNDYKINYSDGSGKVARVIFPNEIEKIELKYSDDSSSTTTQKFIGTELVSEETDYFNSSGNCTKSVDAEGYVTEYTYKYELLHTTKVEVDGRYIDEDGYVQHPQEKKIKTETINLDEEHNVLSEEEEDGTVTSYDYCGDDAGEIKDDLVKAEKEVDGNGNTVLNESYEYDNYGNVTKSYDSVSGTLIKTEYYSVDGSEKDTFRGEVKKEEEFAVLEDGTEKCLSTTSYEYSFDKDGNKTETVSQTIDGKEIVAKTVTDVLGREIYSKDRGKEHRNTYDGFGRLIKTESTETGDNGETISSSVESEYDRNGSLICETDEEGLQTYYEYDNMNRLIKKFQKKDREILNLEETEYSYEDVYINTGAGTSLIKNAFVTTVYVKKPSGGLFSTISQEKTYQNAIGQTVREVKNGIITDCTYDGHGNIITRFEIGESESSVENGMLTLFIYDEDDNQTAEIKNPIFDESENTFKVDPVLSIVEKAEYDCNGNVIKEVDGNGNITEFKYDVEGNLTEVISSDGSSISYCYDVEQEDGTTATVTTDAKGRKSIVKTDDSDRTVEISDLGNPNDGDTAITVKYEYDKKDNVIKEIDSKGNYKKNTYDGRDRLIKTSYYNAENEETLRTVYTYDLTDNITSMADYKVVNSTASLYRYTKYVYDKQKRLVGFAECDETNALCEDGAENDSIISKHLITYEYDFNDNLVSINYPEDLHSVCSVSFEYNDSTQWLERIYVKDSEESGEKCLREYTYTSDNKVASIKDYRGIFDGSDSYTLHVYEYDKFDRPVSIKYFDSSDTDNPKEIYTYEFDKNNNIVKETLKNDFPSDGDKVDEERYYEFNSLNQLIETSIEDYTNNSGEKTLYEYDKTGNRTKEIKTKALTSESPNEETADTTETTVATESDIEDENDETQKETEAATITTTYTYNGLNQLVSSVEDTEGKTTSNVTYVYDQNGNQIKETNSVSNESKILTYDEENRLKSLTKKKEDAVILTQTNLYNGKGQRIRKTETDSEDTSTVKYFYQNDAVLYTADDSNNITAFNINGSEDNVIGTMRNVNSTDEVCYFYNKDVRESTTNLLDSAGESVVSYEYTDFGETTINGNIDFYNEICYTGGIYDKSTELYYLNARYYNPDDAVFITQDTYRGEADDPSSLNLYAYCANNPVTYSDPSGHFPVWAALGAAWGAYDGYKYAKKKKLRGWKKAGAIVGGAASSVINPFKKAGKAYKATKRITRIIKKPKVSKKVVRSIAKAAKPQRIKRTVKKIKKKVVYTAKRVKCKITRKGCFVAGTKVSVEKGFIPIEKVKAGDRVWSEDTRTGKKELKKVKKIFVREKDSIVRLAINGEVIETTDEHPFFVKDIGWIPAGELSSGDLVKLKSNEYASIESYDVITLEEPIKVYNFEVVDNHTYYVSESKVLVHNDYKNKGRSGKQLKLKDLAEDDKVSRSLRGEIKRDINQIKRKKRKNIRVPQGYNLAHRRGKEAAKGYSYKESDLQDINAHKRQHRLERVKKKKR